MLSKVVSFTVAAGSGATEGIYFTAGCLEMTLDATIKLGFWAETALTFFYPDVCQHCHENRATRAEGYVCQTAGAM